MLHKICWGWRNDTEAMKSVYIIVVCFLYPQVTGGLDESRSFEDMNNNIIDNKAE